MTPVRPEHEGAHAYRGGGFHGNDAPSGGPAPDIREAVEAPAGPLPGGLPRQPSPPPSSSPPSSGTEPGGEEAPYDEVSPWFRPRPSGAHEQYGAGLPHGPAGPVPQEPVPQGPPVPGAPPHEAGQGAARAASDPLLADGHEPFADDDCSTVGLRRTEPPGESGAREGEGAREAPEPGGRAARRRAARTAARRRGSRHGRKPDATPPPARAAMSRVEARKAAKAAQREGIALFASRLTGEVFITVGVLMMLFVTYQLWWTNVLAGQKAGGAAEDLHEQWSGPGTQQVDPERRAGSFAPGEGFAIIHIPKIGIRTPIAQGVSKTDVLDKGLVGHYGQEPLKTAMPWDRTGNFALAGHRNTHGEPFRYINKLVAGDEIVVETASKFYTYRMTNRLPATSPSNTSVIDPVPEQSGFTRPGRYVTLTTCTPEFTSKYRLIVWGRMVDERPRSEGKPDALVE